MKKIIFFGVLFLTFSPSYAQWSLIAPCDQAHPHIYHDVFFLNNDTGFVVGDSTFNDGGIILKTMDGGQTWDTTFCQGVIYSIQFIDNDIGFAASNNYYFYKTNDGGDSWTEIVLNPPITYYQTNNSIHFKNALEGYVCSSGASCRLFRTLDGGFSWQQVLTPGTSNCPAGGSVCFASNSIAYVGIGFKTFDGGANWIWWKDSILTTIPNSLQSRTCNDFLTETYGMVGGSDHSYPPNNNRRLIGITHDGGYNYVYKQFTGLYRVNDIAIVDEDMSFAVGELCPPDPQNHSMFLASMDGGDTWNYQEYEHDIVFPYPTMHAVCFPTKKIGYAVSYYGQIYKTTDSGGELIPILSSTKPVVPEDAPNIYPNPVSDHLYILCKNLKVREFGLTIYSATGQVVQNAGMYMYRNDYLEIDVSHLSTGIYILKVTGGKVEQVHKFIKN